MRYDRYAEHRNPFTWQVALRQLPSRVEVRDYSYARDVVSEQRLKVFQATIAELVQETCRPGE
jgi:hypothetical protein